MQNISRHHCNVYSHEICPTYKGGGDEPQAIQIYNFISENTSKILIKDGKVVNSHGDHSLIQECINLAINDGFIPKPKPSWFIYTHTC